MEFAIQLIIILICLFYGARKGGIALGLLGGIGLVILVFVFHLQPGKPPVDVMLVIIAVVAASAIQFDRSGTTHIGRFVINHSFILPGLIGVGVSCVFGWVFAAMYGFL